VNAAETLETLREIVAQLRDSAQSEPYDPQYSAAVRERAMRMIAVAERELSGACDTCGDPMPEPLPEGWRCAHCQRSNGDEGIDADYYADEVRGNGPHWRPGRDEGRADA
jgi:RNA polymerase-binding transcription factor DksA